MAPASVVPATDTQVSSFHPSLCDLSARQLTPLPGYARQEREFPQELPTKPPYTAHLGNLSYDATQESVTDFFDGCEVVSVRIVEDRAEMRPKGFGYAEFATLDGLKKALELEGQSFEGRNIRIRIADPRTYLTTSPILLRHSILTVLQPRTDMEMRAPGISLTGRGRVPWPQSLLATTDAVRATSTSHVPLAMGPVMTREHKTYPGRERDL